MNIQALSLPLSAAHAWEIVPSRDAWEALFRAAPRAGFTQAWCYGEGKRAEGWQVERLMFRDAGRPVALCQLLVKRALFVPITRINRGPVFLEEHVPYDTRLAALRKLRQRWHFGSRGCLLFAPGLSRCEESRRLLRAAGFWCRARAGWTSSVIDLRTPLDELHRRLAPDWRTKIRRAQRLGVTLRVLRDAAAVEWMVDRHVENMRARNFAGPTPTFVRQVTDASAGEYWVLQALIGGEPEAGVLTVRVGSHAENFIAWFSEAARRATAGNLLMWNCIVEMQRAGLLSLDLGGHSIADRYGRFKRGMRGEQYQLAGEWLAF